MSSTHFQPEALRLADQLKDRFGATVPTSQAAAELIRQHERIQTLVDALAKTETYLLERLASNPGSTGATVILPMIRRAIEGAGVAPTQSSWGDFPAT